MIACFTDPYPDEIFYSICARYSEKVRYSSIGAVNRDLFSVSEVTPTIALPSRLATLIDNLPNDYGYSVDTFIDEHTLFPLFRPFLSQDQLLCMREDMREEKGSRAYTRAGMTAYSIPLPKIEHLRFCPICIREDKKIHGQCYWHRTHQAPGVQICPIHKVFLYRIDGNALGTKPHTAFLTAEKIADSQTPIVVNTTDFCESTLLNIAVDVAWIISQQNLSCDSTFLEERYYLLLAERGLAFPHTRKKFNISALLQEFKAYYPAQLLQMLSCNLSEHEMNNWLCHLLYNTSRAKHPLYHILLIRFLGYTVENFFNLSKPSGPFGNGPWPCLNPVSEHYRQDVVYDCSVSVSRSMGKRPRGVFSCECGFVYSRLGPGLHADDGFEFEKILAVGSVWEEALRRFWEDPTVGLRVMSQRLRLHRYALRCHAARLGLSFPRPGGILLEPTRKLQVHLNGGPVTDEAREYHRMLWLKAIDENSGSGSEVIRDKYSKLYYWLYTHDRLWQKEHMPQRTKQKWIRKPRIDWNKRDKQTAEMVVVIALQIRNLEGPPEQVTTAAIMRRIEKGSSLERYLIQGRLPNTKEMLDTIIESCEDFVIRRIWYTRDVYLRDKHILPKRWLFDKQTGAAHYQSSKVREAFEVAMRSLEASFLSGTHDIQNL